MIDTRRPYSVASLAERWSCSAGSVRNLIACGKLGSFQHGKLIRIPAAEVDRYEGNPPDSGSEDGAPAAPSPAPRPVAALPQPNYGAQSRASTLPDWPGAMKRKTAAAYLDLSEAAFDRDVAAGVLPPSFVLGGKPHWRKEALDKALELLCGDGPVPEHIRRFEERHGIKGGL
ncbi:excisionase family DNA binding protein [Novosphingobium chloroacetimidivorans]|uniref:Excisionase family DNA binding protein n=1 Tax=Novosphingobium chloroacetimidivorans TaxID=1428314 RepID=A0A7W7NVE5_9SPHN|nr:helix-turn-helix domain-containing protein [Novosphingobium chloroacetimidivorans]MBB4857209.1 excisionase family DNA binding protein [Novosphingobium chloroacetimidivorans]